jgi:putative toxin-antitoxin system antitoxin component (TIGR02293 family)
MMQASDALTLRAFLSALAQLEHPLDAEVQAELNQLESTWGQDDTSVIKHLSIVAQQYPPLQTRYDIALEELLEGYQSQSRNKFLLLQEAEAQIKPSQPAPPIPSLSLDLVTASHQILGSPESVSTAKRLYRITIVYEHAADVFEDSDIAWDWLQSPNGSLEWKIPLELLETDEGAQKVETILGRIDYGVYS